MRAELERLRRMVERFDFDMLDRDDNELAEWAVDARDAMFVAHGLLTASDWIPVSERLPVRHLRVVPGSHPARAPSWALQELPASGLGSGASPGCGVDDGSGRETVPRGRGRMMDESGIKVVADEDGDPQFQIRVAGAGLELDVSLTREAAAIVFMQLAEVLGIELGQDDAD